MTHYKYIYFPACNEHSDPIPVPCRPNPNDPSTCVVCTKSDPNFPGRELVENTIPSVTCGRTTCPVAINQRVHAGNYHQAPGGWDANQVKNVAAFGNGQIRTTRGIMSQAEWAAGAGQAGPSGSGSGDGESSKKEKKDKDKRGSKDKKEKRDKKESKEKKDKKGKGKDKK